MKLIRIRQVSKTPSQLFSMPQPTKQTESNLLVRAERNNLQPKSFTILYEDSPNSNFTEPAVFYNGLPQEWDFDIDISFSDSDPDSS